MTELQKKYNDKQAEIEVKMARLIIKLAEHKEQQAKESKNWGYLGDLGYVDEKLNEILEFIN